MNRLEMLRHFSATVTCHIFIKNKQLWTYPCVAIVNRKMLDGSCNEFFLACFKGNECCAKLGTNVMADNDIIIMECKTETSENKKH